MGVVPGSLKTSGSHLAKSRAAGVGDPRSILLSSGGIVGVPIYTPSLWGLHHPLPHRGRCPIGVNTSAVGRDT